jgi:hypothetical protein
VWDEYSKLRQMNWTKLGGTPKALCGLPSEQHHLQNRFSCVTSPIEVFGSWRPHNSTPGASYCSLFDMAVARALATSSATQSIQTQFDLLSKSSQVAFLIHSQQSMQPTTPLRGLQEPLVNANEDLAALHKRDSSIHAFLRSKGGHKEKRACPGPIHRHSGLAKYSCFPLPPSCNDQSRAPVLKLSNLSRFNTKWRELLDGSTSSVARERKKALLSEYFSRRISDVHETPSCSRHPANFRPKTPRT